MKYILLFFNLFLCAFCQGQVAQTNAGTSYTDTEGKVINAHGAGVLYYHNVYYLFGEIKRGSTWLVPGQNWEDYRVPAGGISCYSSKDLKHWKNRGVALKPILNSGESELDTGRVIERPKVIYNDKTKKFVMWFHSDKNDYKSSKAGIAVSDSPEGPYKFIESIQPNGQMLRDMTLFKDDDGKAYVIYSSEENNTMHVCLLSDDYLKPTSRYTRILVVKRRESPSIFKYRGKYYLVTSGCTGWAPNAAGYAVAYNIMGPWEEFGNPLKGKDAELSFYSQCNFIQPVVGRPGDFLFMADLWNKLDLQRSGYLWIPFRMKSDKLEIKYRLSDSR